MNFQETIMAINAALAACDGDGPADSAGAAANPTRQARKLLDSLAEQFDTHVGKSVICLPMSDQQPPA